MEKLHDKKIDIINASIHLFSEKGFSQISVQDIATFCNISKATIYKIFKSKEDILISIIKYVNKQTFIAIENVDLELNKDGSLTLEKKLTIFFEHLYKKRNFSIMIYENQNLLKNPKFESIILENRSFIIKWYKKLLLDAFGPAIKPILLDIVFATMGIIKEFNYIFIVRETIAINFNDISKFLVKAIKALIDCHIDDTPLVPSDLFESFDEELTFDRTLLFEEWQKALKKIENKLEIVTDPCLKKDILEATIELTNEIQKPAPRRFLIDSLFLYLSKNIDIEHEILLLKSLYIKLGI
ncbi:MAG: TetR/AcrR family transcriptional regulator [Clostridium sp.]|uniref:TetR/AcrR family transcriptional regulator n=1 Tax=Clostridium sp. TaxID=1506 RepID=UPI003F2A64B2